MIWLYQKNKTSKTFNHYIKKKKRGNNQMIMMVMMVLSDNKESLSNGWWSIWWCNIINNSWNAICLFFFLLLHIQFYTVVGRILYYRNDDCFWSFSYPSQYLLLQKVAILLLLQNSLSHFLYLVSSLSLPHKCLPNYIYTNFIIIIKYRRLYRFLYSIFNNK